MTPDFQEKRCRARLKLLKMFRRAGTGHMSPALSCLDILAVLYLGGVAELKKGPDRDRVILSKGHACAALYAVLAEAGFISERELDDFYQTERLPGHPSPDLPGVETATGSLGHGICFATGVALAAKLDGRSYHSFVLIGDGECQEGSVWEAAMFAGHKKLDNLTVIIDYNRLQASDRLETIIDIEPLAAKWEAFGWRTGRVDGHDPEALAETLCPDRTSGGKPRLIIAETVKGQGLSFMADDPAWHCRVPKGGQWDLVCRELGLDPEEWERP